MQENEKVEWKDHTPHDPYWLSSKPVKVMLKNGVIKEFKCPKCAKGWSNMVVSWKEADNGKTTS